MKTIRNILLVIIFLILVSFCLYIAPNYEKDINEGKINLVINYTNVTGKMKGKILLQDNEVYLSKEDIENYYDKYIYYNEQYNYIIATSNGKYACFNIDSGTLNINDKKSNTKIIKQDDMYYIPISSLEDVYNINVNYIKKSNTVLIESLDRKLETAVTNKNVDVKYKSTAFSRTLEKINSNTKIAIVPQTSKNTKKNDIEKNPETVTSKKEESGSSKIKNIINKPAKFIDEMETKNSQNWTLIRTENGILGYIKNEDLENIQIERESQKEEQKTISLVWEYFSEVGKAPQNSMDTKYKGINVVSPAFFYMNGDTVKTNIGQDGVNYIKWAKSNDYEVWAMIQNDNISKTKMDEFSEWINDYQKRQDVINQIVAYVKFYNLDGINIDFENIYKSDKNALSRFIIELKPRLEHIGATLSVDVTEPDGSDTWSLCFDRNVIGDVSDYIIFMAYDQFGSYSKVPGSTASHNWVEKNIKKFINQEGVEPNKIILGVPLYTRLWKTDSSNETTNTTVAIKNQYKYIPSDDKVQWLEDAKQNYVQYQKNGDTYKMWIENEKSISYKLDLIEKYNLSGAAFWEKGYENEEIWNLVNEKLFE